MGEYFKYIYKKRVWSPRPSMKHFSQEQCERSRLRCDSVHSTGVVVIFFAVETRGWWPVSLFLLSCQYAGFLHWQTQKKTLSNRWKICFWIYAWQSNKRHNFQTVCGKYNSPQTACRLCRLHCVKICSKEEVICSVTYQGSRREPPPLQKWVKMCAS